MAKNPTTKTDDPAALAFSAVENALKESVFASDEADTKAVRREQRAAKTDERRRSGDKIAAQTSAVANDDRFANSKLLYSMQARPSGTPLIIATIVSLVWVAATSLVAWARFGAMAGAPDGASSFFASVDFAALMAIIALPVLGIFAVAILVRRAQDLRIAAASMTQAAMRLTDPETTAADKVATVGQAVRREVNALGDGLERALSRAGELEVMVHNEVTALERTYSENETRLRSLIQELAEQRDAVITNSDRVRDAIGSAHVAMITDLDRIGDSMGETISARGTEARSAIEDATNRFESTLNDRTSALVGQVDNRTADMTTAIESKAERLVSLLDLSTQNLVENFDARTVKLATTIEGRMDSLIAEIDGRTAVVKAAIEDKTGELAAAMTSGGEALVSDLERRGYAMSSSLEEIGTRIASDVSGHTDRAEQILTGLTNRLDESMSIRVNAIESRFQTAIIEIGSVIEENTESARSIIAGAGDGALSSLSARVEEVSVILDTRLQAMDTVVGDKGEILISSLDRHAIEFAGRANLLETALEEKTKRLDTVLETHAGAIAKSMDNRTDGLNLTLEQHGAALDATLERRTGEFGASLENATTTLGATLEMATRSLGATLEDRTTALTGALGDVSDGLARTLEEKNIGMRNAIEDSTRQLGETLGGQTREIAERIATRTQQLSEALGTRTKEFSDTLGTRTQKLSDALAHETENFASVLDTRTQTLTENLVVRTAELSTTIDTKGTTLENRLNDLMGSVDSAIESRTTGLTTLIGTKIEEINSNIGSEIDSAVSRLDDAESGLSNRLSSVSGKIAESARRAAETIEFGVEHARTSITEMVDKRLGTLPEAITARAEITADRLAELNETLTVSLGKSMTDLESGADRIEETITSRIAKATSTIYNDVEMTTARMDVAVRTALEQVKDAARHIEDLVEVKAVVTAEQLGDKVIAMQRVVTEQSAAFADIIDSRSEQFGSRVAAMQREVEEQSAVFSNIIDAKSEQLTGSLRSHGNVLRDALAASARESEALMADSTARISADVNDALKRLNDSNLLLQRVLETTTINLSDLESRVSTQTTSYSATVKDALSATEQAGGLVSEHVNAFQTTMTTMLEQFSGMVSRLDNQTASIDTAAHALQDAGNFSIDTLENRRGAMEALAESFTARADEIDERMRSFAGSIADTVNETERRLIAARRAMEETLATTSETVSEGLESFSSAATAESQRANNVLKQAQQALLAEIQTTLDEATRRFNDTAAAMRSTAGQVGQELEATRSELQRGVLELPEETRASAAAMRRVVAEQIEALNELNSIVRSQSGTHDISLRRPARSMENRPTESRNPEATRAEPRYAEPRQPEPRQPEPRQPETRFVEARQPEQRRPEPAPRQQAFEAQSAPNLAATLSQPAPQPQNERVATPVPAREPASDQSGGGWLRDVLRNASASQQAGVQRTANLSSLSSEIARSIEPGVLSEAWQRYQAGESNVFSRRLYTLSGQGTYDEVRKKLQRDPDFAGTATAYMDEFEQYLQRAASGTNAVTETRALLLSDRGKVYTMLAHAGGRLN